MGNFLPHQGSDIVPQVRARDGFPCIVFQPEPVHIRSVHRRKRIGCRKDGCLIGIGIAHLAACIQGFPGIAIEPFISRAGVPQIGNRTVGDDPEDIVSVARRRSVSPVGLPGDAGRTDFIQGRVVIRTVAAGRDDRRKGTAARSSGHDDLFRIAGRQGLLVETEIADNRLGIGHNGRGVSEIFPVNGFVGAAATAVGNEDVAFFQGDAGLVGLPVVIPPLDEGVRRITVGGPAPVVDIQQDGGVCRGVRRYVDVDQLVFRAVRPGDIIVHIPGHFDRHAIDRNGQARGFHGFQIDAFPFGCIGRSGAAHTGCKTGKEYENPFHSTPNIVIFFELTVGKRALQNNCYLSGCLFPNDKTNLPL